MKNKIISRVCWVSFSFLFGYFTTGIFVGENDNGSQIVNVQNNDEWNYGKYVNYLIFNLDTIIPNTYMPAGFTELYNDTRDDSLIHAMHNYYYYLNLSPDNKNLIEFIRHWALEESRKYKHVEYMEFDTPINRYDMSEYFNKAQHTSLIIDGDINKL